MPILRVLVVVFIVASSALTGVITQAKERSRPVISALNGDHLGESLRKFRSRHKGARCHRRSNEESDERSLKKEWLLWVDCGLEKGVTFNGQELLAEANPYQPFGMFATFYEKKLVELNYTLAVRSVKELLPILEGQFGKPDRISLNRDGDVDSATWTDRTTSLAAELVPLSPAVADGGFLRISKGSPSYAVRVRMCLSSIPSSDR